MLTSFEVSGHAPFWVDVYNNWSESRKGTFYGKWLKEIVKISVGQPFPEFILPDVTGKQISSKDFIRKNKLTIVHFWTSSTTDRVKFQDELKGLWSKYHTLGLNIIAISADKDDSKWRDQVKTDGLDEWCHVSDLKGREGVVGKVYREEADAYTDKISNVLVDEKGKIVAWGVSGLKLQYYLWKYFGK